MIQNEPRAYDLAQNYLLDSLNKSKDSDILLKTKIVTYTKDIDLLSQEREHQDYYIQRDQ